MYVVVLSVTMPCSLLQVEIKYSGQYFKLGLQLTSWEFREFLERSPRPVPASYGRFVACLLLQSVEPLMSRDVHDTRHVTYITHVSRDVHDTHVHDTHALSVHVVCNNAVMTMMMMMTTTMLYIILCGDEARSVVDCIMC